MRLKILMLATAAAATAVTLAGCQPRVEAPRDLGVCYFIGHPKGADGKATIKFNPIAKNQPDVEHCAVALYSARTDMLKTGTAGEVTEGAYQGSFLFITNTKVSYSTQYDGPAFPLLVKDPYSERLVQPGAVQVDDSPADNGPHNVEVPKNLPQKADAAAGTTGSK